jgi:hypothetical protein
VLTVTKHNQDSSGNDGKVEGIGVMKDEEITPEEKEGSHTLGGVGEVTRGEGR